MKNKINEVNDGLKQIKPANLAKRLFAIIMDAAVFVFTAAMLIGWVTTPIAEKAFNYTSLMTEGAQRQAFSGLYVMVKTSDESKPIVNIDEYTTIQKTDEISIIPLNKYENADIPLIKERLEYYYTSYLTNNNVKIPNDVTSEKLKATFYDPNYADEINGVARIDYYTVTWFNNKFENNSTLDDWKSSAVEALNDFYFSPCFTSLNNKVKGIQIFISLPPIVLSYLIYYLLIPLLMKNGETLGKKVLSLSLTTKDGFTIKKRQVVFRQLILFVYILLFASYFSIGNGSLAFIGLAVVIYMMVFVFSKNNRSFADMAAYTLLVDAKTSVWFKDQETLDRKEAQVNENVKTVKSKKIDNKNVIQIGSKIIDENIKKELQDDNK